MTDSQQDQPNLLDLLSFAERVRGSGSWLLHHQNQAIQASPVALSLLGLPPEEAPSELAELQANVHPYDVHLLPEKLRRAWLDAQPFTTVHRIKSQDGSIRLIQHQGTTICTSDGEPIQTVVLTTDVTTSKDKLNTQNYDELTGLWNKKGILTQLTNITRELPLQQQISAICIDIDNFSGFNDSFGIDIGDQILKWFAANLKEWAKPDDHVARLDNDTFLIVHFAGINCLGDAIQCAKELQAHLRNRTAAELNLDMAISACMGVSVFPDHASSSDDLLRCATTALMEARRQGPGELEVYSTLLSQRIRERLDLHQQLAHAIERNQLQLFFQPQWNRQEELIGAEALVRWSPRAGERIDPEIFIPIAEASGLIHELGSWVIDHSLKHLHEWLAAGLNPPPIAINVSGTQLKRPASLESFDVLVNQMIQQHQIPTELIELELTESVLLHNPKDACACLQRLADLGLSLAIDDFGTGFSSLALLQQLPLNKLKIDRCFVDGLDQSPQNQSIVKASILMAHELGLACLAEGVGTQAEQTILLEQG